MYTARDGVRIARLLEPLIAANGAHIGLTGGCLYKEGSRKDIDFVIHKHNDADNAGQPIQRNAIEGALIFAGIQIISVHPRVTKIKVNDIPVDLIFAEEAGIYTDQSVLAGTLDGDPIEDPF